MQDRFGEGGTLKSVALTYSYLGDNQLSADTSTQALSIFPKIGDRANVAQTLDNIGTVYREESDYPKALEYYAQALKLWDEQKDVFKEFVTLTKVVIYESLKDYPKALEVANQILLLSQKQKNSFTEASAYAFLGRVYLASRNYQKALDASTKAASQSQKLGFRLFEASVLGNIGKAYNSLKQPDKAISIYNQQLGLQQKLGVSTGVADTLYNIAVTERDRNNFQLSRTKIESVKRDR